MERTKFENLTINLDRGKDIEKVMVIINIKDAAAAAPKNR
jgi:hypothetical protein